MAVKHNADIDTGQIESLIGLLMSDHDLPADLLESLQAWLINDNEAAAEKDLILENNFDRIVDTHDGKEYALESWPELARKLGLEPWTEELDDTGADVVRGPGTVRRTPRAVKLRMDIVRYAAVAIICLSIPVLILMKQRMPQTGGGDVISAAVEQAEPVTATTASDTATLWFPDGSRATMRGNTTISYADDFELDRRVVIDGEAFFVVSHDDRRPFTVEGRGVTVTVAGTEFNIRAYDTENKAEVALIAGTVTVVSPAGEAILKPYETAVIDRAGKIMEVKPLNEGAALRARGANLLLAGVTLEKAFDMISGYFDIAIDLPPGLPAIDGIVLDLQLDASPEDALFLLHAVSPVFDYRMDNGSVSVTARNL